MLAEPQPRCAGTSSFRGVPSWCRAVCDVAVALGRSGAKRSARLPDSEPAPAYFVEAYGDRLETVEEVLFDLSTFNFEAVLALEPDRLVFQESFEPFVTPNAELLGGPDRLLFVDHLDWRAAFAQLAEEVGVEPDEVLEPYVAEYAARIDALAASLDYDPAVVVASSFSFDGERAGASDRTSPLALTLGDLGFPLLDAAFPVIDGPLSEGSLDVSTELILDLDADLVMIRTGRAGLDEVLADPVWSQADAVQRGNVFETFQYSAQGGWREQVQLLDDLATILPTYRP